MYPDNAVSLIFEILQAVDEADAIKAARQAFSIRQQPFCDSELYPHRFHFDSVAHDNDAVTSQVEEVYVMPGKGASAATPSPIVLRGTQTARKFNRKAPDTVHILMALYRVEQKKADLVVTFNIPIKSEDPGVVTESEMPTVKQHFDEIVKSLVIQDLNLFA